MWSKNPLRLGGAVVLSAIFSLMSCEKIIDISIPDQERKLVVNGLISPDREVRVNLTKSLSVLEKDSLLFASGADVRLFDSDSMIGVLREDSLGFYSLPDFAPVSGKSYTLKATSGNLEPIEATAMVPGVVNITSLDTMTLQGEYGSRGFNVSVRFNDPPGVKNIYGFGVNVTYKEFDYMTQTWSGRKITDPLYIMTNSDGMTEDEFHHFGAKIFVDDLLFDGQSKHIEFGFYPYFMSDTVWVEVRLEQIEPAYYLHALSQEAYNEANGNPFAEPVQVYTNVKGGFGIFAGSSFDSRTIVMKGMGKY